MAAIKSYTDINQSKRLAEILPLESADMFLAMNGTIPMVSKYFDEGFVTADNTAIPCWSLASLLDILPKTINNETLFIETSPALWHIGYRNIYTERADNPVDACVAMIEKLHELNLL